MKIATYETYAAFVTILETGNLETFKGLKPKPLASFLKKQFYGRKDPFIVGDAVLSRLNPRRIQYMPLARCLSAGNTCTGTLDLTCIA